MVEGAGGVLLAVWAAVATHGAAEGCGLEPVSAAPGERGGVAMGVVGRGDCGVAGRGGGAVSRGTEFCLFVDLSSGSSVVSLDSLRVASVMASSSCCESTEAYSDMSSLRSSSSSASGRGVLMALEGGRSVWGVVGGACAVASVSGSVT